MAKRNAAIKPDPDVQLLDSMDMAHKRIEVERERIFDAGALIEILSRSVHDPKDHSVVRTCDQICNQLDAVASALELISRDLAQAGMLHRGDLDLTEVPHG